MGEHPALDDLILKKELGAIELKVLAGYTLSDAIRDGAQCTDKSTGSFMGPEHEGACALTAAYIAARARGYIQ
jgi:hypothetical protein